MNSGSFTPVSAQVAPSGTAMACVAQHSCTRQFICSDTQRVMLMFIASLLVRLGLMAALCAGRRASCGLQMAGRHARPRERHIRQGHRPALRRAFIGIRHPRSRFSSWPRSSSTGSGRGSGGKQAGCALGHQQLSGGRAGDRQRVEPKGLHRGCRGQGERRRHPGANTLEMVPTEMVQGQRLPLATLDDNATAGMH